MCNRLHRTMCRPHDGRDAGDRQPVSALAARCPMPVSRWRDIPDGEIPMSSTAVPVPSDPREHLEQVILPFWLEHGIDRSEEHTSELQSRGHLVCRLLLEKKK